jgi:predicted amidohydrolase
MRPIVLLAVILTAGAALRADDVIRVGLIQMDGQIYDKEYNLARAEKGIQAAAARGATLLCTPEVAVQGYPRLPMPPGTSFDSPELVAGRAKILSAAETIPDGVPDLVGS